MRRIALLPIAAAVLYAGVAVAVINQTPAVEVHKDSCCTCFPYWTGQMSREGFEVTVSEPENVLPAEVLAAVPAEYRSCVTSRVSGYVVSGPVPPEAVRNLLLEKPRGVIGLTVKAPPAANQALEFSTANVGPVIALKRDGTTEPFDDVLARE